MNLYLIAILTILAVNYLFRFLAEILNLRALDPDLPEEFKGYYQPESYRKSQRYLTTNTKFNLVQETVFTLAVVGFILIGGFNLADRIARSLNLNFALTGLIFAGIIIFVAQILELPFSWYRTFVIEERYGFNQTRVKTFIADKLKSWLLLVIIGGLPFYAIIVLFASFGPGAWIWCWLGVVIFSWLITFIYPLLILPLFNKFRPLEDGELKNAVNRYADSQKFALKGIYKIDGSRRSTKANAFFCGFGKSRRIALYDTLIQKHSVSEIVSVLAHEVGHYKKNHILKNFIYSILTKGLMFYLLSFFINNPGLFEAFRMEQISVYASLIFFSFLYTPIGFIFSIVGNLFSRRHEYEADRFSVTTYDQPEAFILALKKLTVNNLSNLTPHHLKVFLDYSHPPVLERIRQISRFNPEKSP
ncbi:MAG: M48 family metallopeptidase [Candidatus Omnitrophica bacterium]|nr:M48 family metallopeptidase [Candidatus Omnitrophota bacterium]